MASAKKAPKEESPAAEEQVSEAQAAQILLEQSIGRLNFFLGHLSAWPRFDQQALERANGQDVLALLDQLNTFAQRGPQIVQDLQAVLLGTAAARVQPPSEAEEEEDVSEDSPGADS